MEGTKKPRALVTGGFSGEKIYAFAFSQVKKRPRVLIFPTAGHDDEEQMSHYRDAVSPYTDDFTFITLTKKTYDKAALREKILSADMILVGGGQSEFMLEVWQKHGVDALLREAYERGVFCFGGSAGGMCWTYAGWNDFYTEPERTYEYFYGLDVLHFYYGPHFDASALWGRFEDVLLSEKTPVYPEGYAMENKTAVLFEDGRPTATVKDNEEAHVYHYVFRDGKWGKETMV